MARAAGEQTEKSHVLEPVIWVSGPRVCIMNLSACVDFMELPPCSQDWDCSFYSTSALCSPHPPSDRDALLYKPLFAGLEGWVLHPGSVLQMLLYFDV